ncbi:MAG: hypothetical protein E7275_08435 [Pseudobutyrivibrio sp.]|uniref:hypothetical protein n=1 Tax=unclassified Pseudobutyrivibrio TaxID=2638619 RepID=UPI00088AA3A6|nr:MULTISPECIES: hypothetical protein [unclassified Pseudobutyrivibrio]MBE5904301.1 hypothetical protein [Pseudobutyrivibrio sp.]SCY50483.1 hypothetical protein SAMN05660668_02851 [Pseudobutyrivibrio sp. AR14]
MQEKVEEKMIDALQEDTKIKENNRGIIFFLYLLVPFLFYSFGMSLFRTNPFYHVAFVFFAYFWIDLWNKLHRFGKKDSK